jgi:hypothetical protein
VITRAQVSKWLKRWLRLEAFAEDESTSHTPWFEVAVIAFGAVGLAWLTRPHDPTLMTLRFPWLWIAPILISLRYGVMPGLLGSIPLIGNELLASQLGRVSGDFSAESFFGGGLLTLICGEFSDVWRDRNNRMQETYLYVTERLSRLTKRHLLLNLSHDRLEQEMLSRPGSLRDALARLRSITMDAKNQNEPMPGANGLLQLLSQYVNIESAAIYTLRKKSGSYVLGKCVATLGDPDDLAPDDELLRLALEKGTLAHIANEDVSLQRRTQQLVVAPLVAGDANLIGVLAVTRMPFFSLNVENLQMMLVMLGYFADNLGVSSSVIKILDRLPTMPVLFAQELACMIKMQVKIGITSHLVVMSLDGQRRQEIAVEFLRVKRGLDLYWQTYVNNRPVLTILMPFTSSAAKDGFLQRIEDWLKQRFQGDFESLGIRLRIINFDSEDPLMALTEVINSEVSV